MVIISNYRIGFFYSNRPHERCLCRHLGGEIIVKSFPSLLGSHSATTNLKHLNFLGMMKIW